MHWEIFLQPATFGDTSYLGWLFLGIKVTILVSICAEFVAFIVGSFFGILKSLPYKSTNFIATVYVEYFRNIPLIIHLFIFVNIVPMLLPDSMREWLFDLDPVIFNFVLGFVCLGLFMGARMCEQVRAAIQSISIGQTYAGKALGFNLWQIYIYILLPNAYRRIIHPMTSEILNLVKNSAVLSTIGLVDLTMQANQLHEYTGYAYESFIAVTVSYVIINFIIIHLMRYIDKCIQLPGMLGGGK